MANSTPLINGTERIKNMVRKERFVKLIVYNDIIARKTEKVKTQIRKILKYRDFVITYIIQIIGGDFNERKDSD